MPVYAAISPTFSNTEAMLDALNSATFYAESTAVGKNRHSVTHTTTLAHFERVFVFMVDPLSSKWAAFYSYFIGATAFTSCLMLFMQTLDGPNHHSTFPDYPTLPTAHQYQLSDTVFTIIFTVEFLLRLVIWPSMWKDHDYLLERRLKPFLRDFFNWFDVAALIPFYTEILFGNDFVILRLCRLLRIFKLARNHSGTYILLRAIRASLAPISIALIFFLEIVLFFSVVMYMVDPSYDRNKNGFSDLLTSSYFVVVTIATIGYGDIVPTKGNFASRTCAVLIIMSGTLFLSMPLAIIGTEFDRAWKDHAEAVRKHQLQGQAAELAAAGDTDPNQKHEVLVKYNVPNKLYLRLAAFTGEASLMVQALVAEVSSGEISTMRLREIADDLSEHIDACFQKCGELGTMVKEMIVPDVQQAPVKPTWKQWLHTTLSDPQSSLLARCISRWIYFCLILSMIIVVFQTMPDLQTYGEETFLCERSVKHYCENAEDVTPVEDPGCFRTDDPLLPLRFECSDVDKLNDPSCYGYGTNYGCAESSGLSCSNTTTVYRIISSSIYGTSSSPSTLASRNLSLILPFRPDMDLSTDDRKISVCKRWECDNWHTTFLEFGNAYTALEYMFTLTYVFEFAAEMYTCDDYRAFFMNPVVYIEMASFIPFFVYEGRRFASGTEPIYVITPGSRDFLSFLRLLRVFRIFKIQQRIPVTKVLWESISKTSSRLAIPYFMLILVTTILSFIMYELEKGTECFYGELCIVNDVNLTYPIELYGSPLHKRFLVNAKGKISSFDDFFSAFWFVIVTVATIGYGDMEPVSTSGKLVAVIAMLFGACYTAMPLTLVGSQFNKSYREHKRREALLRTKVEVSKPFPVAPAEFNAWEIFGLNKEFGSMKNTINTALVPLVHGLGEDSEIEEAFKEKLSEIANELKDTIYSQRVCVHLRVCLWVYSEGDS